MVRPVDRVLKVSQRVATDAANQVPMVRPVDRVLKDCSECMPSMPWIQFPWSDPWIGY